MDDALKIYVDHLKQGKVERIERALSSKFLEVDEPDLSFKSEVSIRGEAYIADDGLVIHVDIGAEAQIPCSICNEPVLVPISIKGFYHVEPLDNIRAGVFYLGDIIRESILLEVPSFAECGGGNCPQRKVLGKYFKKELSQEVESEDEGYRPFSNLE